MENTAIILEPIGVIRTPNKDGSGSPIQPLSADGLNGHIELNPKFADGLKDLDGFSHVILIYYFHKISDYSLKVIPFMDTEERGIFACRAPKRPNKIGISTVRISSIEGNKVFIEDVDMLDNSPLLDIKPFYPQFDNKSNVKSGWLDKVKIEKNKLYADNRFK